MTAHLWCAVSLAGYLWRLSNPGACQDGAGAEVGERVATGARAYVGRTGHGACRGDGSILFRGGDQLKGWQ